MQRFRLSGIFILFFVLFWGQASFVLIQVIRSLHYADMHSGSLPESKFRDTICTSAEGFRELQWQKKDEIRYKGRMFDVKRKLASGDKILLVGHYDKKDDTILQLISALFSGDAPGAGRKLTGIKIFMPEAIMPGAYLQEAKQSVQQGKAYPFFWGSHYELCPESSLFRPPISHS